MSNSTTGVNLGRRQFLVAGSVASGGLVVGLPSIALADTPDSDTGNSGKIGFFVQINPDNSVVIGSNQPEIGQGVRTVLPMVVAEELDIEWESVSVESMPLGLIRTEDGFTWKYGGQGVGGSTGTRGNFQFMREVGATARHLLIQAAAEQWNVPASQCSTTPGFVVCEAIDKKIAYGDIAARAAALPVPEETPALKEISNYRIAGKAQNSVDIPEVVTGQAKFGIDTRVEGMKYAVIARSPYLNGSVESFDDTETRKVPGVIDVVRIEGPKPGEPYLILADGVAVVADSTWAAIKGREALNIIWNKGPNTQDSSERFWKENREMLKGQGQIVRDDGSFTETMANAITTLTRQYDVPFANHAPLEPQNCFAHVTDDHCRIIVPTQSPSGSSRSAAAVTGLERDKISVDMTRVGGGFGRRLTTDYVAEAAMISMKTRLPIQLQWTREDDVKHDFYRPAGTHELRAGLDNNGQVTAWAHSLASASKYYRRPDMPDENLYQSDLYVDDYPANIVENFQMEYFHNAIGVPRGSWRAPAHTANAFVIQSFIDELAHESGQDPLAFQLKLLGEARELPYSGHGGPVFNPGRLSRLLEFVAGKIDYTQTRDKGRGVGLATHFTFGGYAAHAFDVTVSQSGELKINKIVAAIDCGFAVNPNGVDAQMEGGTIDGLSTALGLEITVKDGQIVQSNFHDYPLMRMAPVPVDFETHILPWGEEPAGVGEMGIPSVAPALTNAIFAASGVRLRKLPIAEQLRQAMS